MVDFLNSRFLSGSSERSVVLYLKRQRERFYCAVLPSL